MKFVRFFIVSVLIFYTGSSWCCINLDPKSFAISFAADAQDRNSVVINLKDQHGDSHQILDDTGYISIDLAITALSKKSVDAKVNLNDVKPMVQFMLGRLDILDRQLNSYLKNNYADVGATIDQFRSILNKGGTVQRSDLVAGWDGIGSKLHDHNLDIRAAQRNPPETDWGRQLRMGELDIPSRVVTRSIGCTSGKDIAGFNPTIGSAQGTQLSQGTKTTGD